MTEDDNIKQQQESIDKHRREIRWTIAGGLADYASTLGVNEPQGQLIEHFDAWLVGKRIML